MKNNIITRLFHKKKSLQIFKSILCKIFWYFGILQILILIYLIAPKPSEPMIMLENNFIQIDGPNIVKEGDNTNIYTLHVNKDLNQELNVTLKYSGTAKKDKDYTAPKSVTIKKGELSSTFTIKTIDDPIAEFNDEFAVRIMSVTGEKFFKEYNISNASNVIYTKILDEKNPKNIDDQSTVITIDGAETIYENSKIYKYTVHLSQNAVEDIDLNISYKGNATYGVDYKAPHHLVIKKGENSATFKIETINDIYKELKEFIDVYISDFDDIGFEDIRYERSHFNIHIKDEENPKEALLLKLHAPKQAKENTLISYTLTPSETIIEDFSLSFGVKANDNNIYKDNIIATIKKEKQKSTFTLKVKDDNLIEKRQYLTLESLNTTNSVYELVNIDMQENKTNIIDNLDEKTEGAKIKLSTKASALSEDSDSIAITVTSSQIILENLEFIISYDGIAKNGIDFKGTSKVTIKKGEKSATFFIEPINDNIAEGEEIFSISLRAMSNGGLEYIEASTPLSITINDEVPSSANFAVVSLTGPSKIAESKDGNYTIHISQKLEDDLKVELAFTENTAKKSIDFSPLTTVTIPKGKLSQSFYLHTIDNDIAQTVRDFKIKIKSISGGGFEKIVISPTDNALQTIITDKIDIENAFKRIVASKKIVFAYAKASVDEKSFPILNDIAALLIQFPSVDLIVEGHTNSSGNRYRNKKLSKRRAKSVKEYLITQGVDKTRISSIGYGQSRPMVSDSNPKAQEINKRVEFKVKYRSVQ